MQLINLHTHHVNEAGQIQILNIFAQDLHLEEPDFFFSAGLHPWHLDNVSTEECFRAIERTAKQKNMLAIGECGLDRSIKMDFAFQRWCFEQQINIAEKFCKPLIVHCVRAYSDLLKHKKEHQLKLPWIIHGYHGNLETTMSMINCEFFFSVGKRFLKDKTKQDIFRLIPLERLFLETDESEITILEIYSLAAQTLGIDIEFLSQTITNNFKAIFGDDRLYSECQNNKNQH